MTPITIVSLGSGEPEDITLRAYRALQDVERIYAIGEAAVEIIRALPSGPVLEKKVTILSVPMQSDRRAAASAYEALAGQLEADCLADISTALVTIGDAGTYSSAGYVCRLLRERDMPHFILPGIPYYMTLPACLSRPLVLGEQSLLVLSRVESAEQLREAIDRGRVVVVMKLSRSEEAVRDFLRTDPPVSILYGEYIGDEERELVTDSLRSLPETPFPYFSLLIIKPSTR